MNSFFFYPVRMHKVQRALQANSKKHPLRPYQIGHHELSMAPSMGIALFPKMVKTLKACTQSADVAMYHAKLDGRNTYRFFTPQMHAKSVRALQLENAMRRALKRNEFTLHYQPQICLHTGDIRSVEALLRWNQPELGQISPAEFIPVAEDSGQICKLGNGCYAKRLPSYKPGTKKASKSLKWLSTFRPFNFTSLSFLS